MTEHNEFNTMMVTAACGYQMVNDGDENDAREIIARRLHEGVKQGDLLAFDLTNVLHGPYDINYCAFTVDVPIGGKAVREGASFPEAKEGVIDLLNRIIFDTDVEVHFLSEARIPATIGEPLRCVVEGCDATFDGEIGDALAEAKRMLHEDTAH